MIQQNNEADPLLDSPRQTQYGGIGDGGVAQPDEEELRRERQALDQITADAAEYVAMGIGQLCRVGH